MFQAIIGYETDTHTHTKGEDDDDASAIVNIYHIGSGRQGSVLSVDIFKMGIYKVTDFILYF